MAGAEQLLTDLEKAVQASRRAACTDGSGLATVSTSGDEQITEQTLGHILATAGCLARWPRSTRSSTPCLRRSEASCSRSTATASSYRARFDLQFTSRLPSTRRCVSADGVVGTPQEHLYEHVGVPCHQGQPQELASDLPDRMGAQFGMALEQGVQAFHEVVDQRNR